MNLNIAQGTGTPVYQQIINQIQQLITEGRLQAGHELPPIRVLAEQLVINPNTVARAYRELELSGWVIKRAGAGTFVAEPSAGNDAVDGSDIKQRLQQAVSQAKRQGVSKQQVHTWVDTVYQGTTKRSAS